MHVELHIDELASLAKSLGHFRHTPRKRNFTRHLEAISIPSDAPWYWCTTLETGTIVFVWHWTKRDNAIYKSRTLQWSFEMNDAFNISTKYCSVVILSKARSLCVPASRHFLDSSQSVTPKRGRDNICDEKLSAAALLCLPTYFGSAVSRATASSCWLQYKSSRNKRTVLGDEIYCESPLSIISGNSEKDKVELIPSW